MSGEIQVSESYSLAFLVLLTEFMLWLCTILSDQYFKYHMACWSMKWCIYKMERENMSQVLSGTASFSTFTINTETDLIVLF